MMKRPEKKVWTKRAMSVQKVGKYVEGWNDCWRAFDEWLRGEQRPNIDEGGEDSG